MIRATDIEWIKRAFYLFESKVIFPRKFKKITVEEIDVRPGHSVLLLQNHFSWWDGFLGSYIAYKYLRKSYHVMVQEDQLKQRPYFRFKGAFSIKKKSKEIFRSLDYTKELLTRPDNMVLIFPQGKLQSLYTEEIEIEKGVYKLLKMLPENCQVIYNAVTVDYFESFKPSLHCHLLDCGTKSEIDSDMLSQKLSDFHHQVRINSVRK